MKKALWLTVYGANLATPEAITRLAVDFALAPAREAWGLRPPLLGEHDDFLYMDIEPIGRLPARMMREHHQRVSAAHFEPVLHGLLLFGWLFPGARLGTDAPGEVVKLPGPAFLSDSQGLAYRTYEEIAYLAAGALGISSLAPLCHGSNPYRAVPSPDALAELRVMQDLITRALGEPDEVGDYRRIHLGFQAMDVGAADELDTILRRDVHKRLIWLGGFELFEPDDVDDSIPISPFDFITFDRGVFPTLVPESLSGLIALDLVEYLRLDRGYARCARCRAPVQLTPQQQARAKRLESVFHPECHVQHRLQYGRDYQRRRAQHWKGVVSGHG